MARWRRNSCVSRTYPRHGAPAPRERPHRRPHRTPALVCRLRREAGEGIGLLHDHRQRAHRLARPYREPPDTAMRSPVTMATFPVNGLICMLLYRKAT